MAAANPLIQTLAELGERFSDDSTCATFLKLSRWGPKARCVKCIRDATHYPATGRRSWACEWCGHQIYPTAGTILQGTKVPLTAWFRLLWMLDQDPAIAAKPSAVWRAFAPSECISATAVARIQRVLLARQEREADWLAGLKGTAPAGFAPERLVIDRILAHAPPHLRQWPFGKGRRATAS